MQRGWSRSRSTVKSLVNMGKKTSQTTYISYNQGEIFQESSCTPGQPHLFPFCIFQSKNPRHTRALGSSSVPPRRRYALWDDLKLRHNFMKCLKGQDACDTLTFGQRVVCWRHSDLHRPFDILWRRGQNQLKFTVWTGADIECKVEAVMFVRRGRRSSRVKSINMIVLPARPINK